MATGVGQLSFSRSAEAEADRIGLEYMARAGYDPQAAIQLWQNMEAATAGSGQPPEFLSTHPNPGNRIEAIQAALPEVPPHYENTPMVSSADQGRVETQEANHRADESSPPF